MIAIDELNMIKYNLWFEDNLNVVNYNNKWYKFIKASVINDRIVFFEKCVFIKVEDNVINQNVAAVNTIYEKFVSLSLY